MAPPQWSAAVLVIVLASASVHVADALPPTIDGNEVEKFTGGHTRLVWLTDAENRDSFAERDRLQVMGFDSRDGKGERVIWGEQANYYRPLITPDGDQIVFSNRKARKIYAVGWDGSRPRLLRESGCASEVWRDPKTGKTWVYYQENPNDYTTPVSRFPLDEPSKVEPVWSSSTCAGFALVPAFSRRQDGGNHIPLAELRSRGTSRCRLAQASRRLLASHGAR